MMKTHSFFLLSMLMMMCFRQAYATNLYVNPSVIPNTIPNTYATIPAAIDGASNGDQIFIKPGSYGFNVVISKNISLIPDTVGGIIDMANKSISVTLSSGYKVQLVGFSCGGINIISVNNTVRPKISIVDCLSGYISSGTGDYETNILRSTVVGDISINNGSIIASKTNNLLINNIGQGSVNDTINKNLIAADTILNDLIYKNESRKFIVANNLLKNLYIYSWNYYGSNMNLVWNNEFLNNSKIVIPIHSVPKYKLDISNNIFNNTQFPSSPINLPLPSVACNNCPPGNWSTYGIPAYFYGGDPSYSTNIQYSWNSCWINGGMSTSPCFINMGFTTDLSLCVFPNSDISGILKWTYNGIALGAGIGSGVYPITNIAGTTNIVDAGNPDPKYMDIDMTVNDRGRLGGPYSILNYNPTLNPSNGKAYIYDIELPEVISSPTQPIQIKASGYHRN